MPSSTRTVHFYFDFSSTNSYFAALMLPDICARTGAMINWIPVHFAALFRGTGFDVMAMTPRKARYLWRDHQRYAEFTGLPFRRPNRFPIKTSSALRAVLAAGHAARPHSDDAARESAKGRLTQAVMRAYWERDEDISERAVLVAIAQGAGFDGHALLELADSHECRAELAETTAEAIRRGVFGAPTCRIDEEIFWGKDRLDFVERMLKARK